MYVPTTGRFLSREPSPTEDEVLHSVPGMRDGVRDEIYQQAYVYANNRPTVLADPSGHFPAAFSLSDLLNVLKDFRIIIEYGTFCGRNRRPTSCPVTQADKDRAIDCVDHVCLEHDCCLDTWKEVCNPITFIRCHTALCNGVKACADHGCKSGNGWDRLKCKLAAHRIIMNYCPGTVIGEGIEDIFGL